MKRTVLILALFLACASFAFGQAMPGARRLGDLQVGGTFTFGYPDYTPQNALGWGLYADVDLKSHWGAEVDFHQISIQQHSPAWERTFEYGVRYHRTYGRFNPYLKGMAGHGTFNFAPEFIQGAKSDGYFLATAGGGVDTQLTNRLNVRIEGEYQDWFSNHDLPHGLTPILYQVGVAYHFFGGGATY